MLVTKGVFNVHLSVKPKLLQVLVLILVMFAFNLSLSGAYNYY